MSGNEKDYILAIQADKEKFEKYHLKSLSEKTERQKFLESLLAKEKIAPTKIADIAC